MRSFAALLVLAVVAEEVILSAADAAALATVGVDCRTTPNTQLSNCKRWIACRDSGGTQCDDGNGNLGTNLGMYNHRHWYNVVGSIPGDDLAKMTGLTHLTFSSHKKLKGPIPVEIGLLTNLKSFSFYKLPNFDGPLPESIENLVKLETLDVSHNKMSGPIPASFLKLTNLIRFHAYSNEFSGPIPTDIGDMTNLMHVYVNGNKLSGTIPSSFGRMKKMTSLYAGKNKISGTIPPELGQMEQMAVIIFNDNQLSGTIPGRLFEIGSQARKQHLNFENNKLTGRIPNEIGNLPGAAIYFKGNFITGADPGICKLQKQKRGFCSLAPNPMWTNSATTPTCLNTGGRCKAPITGTGANNASSVAYCQQWTCEEWCSYFSVADEQTGVYATNQCVTDATNVCKFGLYSNVPHRCNRGSEAPQLLLAPDA